MTESTESTDRVRIDKKDLLLHELTDRCNMLSKTLLTAKWKLEAYYHVYGGGEEIGGMEYSALMRRIDDTLKGK